MLADVQKKFSRAIVSNEIDQALTDEILPSVAQLRIYHDSISAIMMNTLRDIYPVIDQLVGEAFFNAMAAIYWRKHRSMSPDLSDLGEHFPLFLDNFEPAQALPYLPDVARCEWVWHRLEYSIENKPISAAELQTLTLAEQEKIIFRLPHDSTLMQSTFPVWTIWQSHTNDAWVDEINVDSGPEHMIAWRDTQLRRVDKIDATLWTFLSFVEQEKTLEELCVFYGDEITVLLSKAVSAGFLHYN